MCKSHRILGPAVGFNARGFLYHIVESSTRVHVPRKREARNLIGQCITHVIHRPYARGRQVVSSSINIHSNSQRCNSEVSICGRKEVGFLMSQIWLELRNSSQLEPGGAPPEHQCKIGGAQVFDVMVTLFVAEWSTNALQRTSVPICASNHDLSIKFDYRRLKRTRTRTLRVHFWSHRLVPHMLSFILYLLRIAHKLHLLGIVDRR